MKCMAGRFNRAAMLALMHGLRPTESRAGRAE